MLKATAILPKKVEQFRMCNKNNMVIMQDSDFQPRFRGAPAFREHLSRVPRLVISKK